MFIKKSSVATARLTPRTKAQLERLAKLRGIPPGTLHRELLERALSGLMRESLARARRKRNVYKDYAHEPQRVRL